ncbi:hypothetical protein [Lysobacter antibioticus]|uniref:hypothetical protein n=1 Tax=Lysobacter antibioticus TaxID=84531 RepID=UPI0007E8C5FA|nr:hypothetical protein [Lysobacter antibioticus]
MQRRPPPGSDRRSSSSARPSIVATVAPVRPGRRDVPLMSGVESPSVGSAPVGAAARVVAALLALVCASTALWGTANLLVTAVTGVVRQRRAAFAFAEQPLRFVLEVGAQALVSLLCAGIACAAVRIALGRDGRRVSPAAARRRWRRPRFAILGRRARKARRAR